MLLIRPSGPPSLRHTSSSARWTALVQPSGKIRQGEALELPGREALIRIERDLGSGYMTLRFDAPAGTVKEIIGSAHVPLPPYIRKARRRSGRPEEMPQLDRDRYQTVYARHTGAVAAPTAGLHFTRNLLREIRDQGVEIRHLTLLVGPGTFMPVRTENIEEHAIEPEFYHLPHETATAVRDALTGKRRIVATGTTTVRVLEHVARTDSWSGHSGWADIYIHPPFEFRATGALITNFHLPRSTLLMLVAAFAGRDNILTAYREAVGRKYRFYSYGDATFLY